MTPNAATTSTRPVDLIVIHCSATHRGKPISQGKPGTPGYKNAAKVIDSWHANSGFARRFEDARAFNTSMQCIGYHYVIDLNGVVYSGRGLQEIGAHAQNFNSRSVGICLVGGAEREAKYTAAQWRSLAEVVSMLLAKYGLPAAPPRRKGNTISGGVCGHRDVSPDLNADGTIEAFEWLKTCPGFDVAAWLKNGMRPTAAQMCEVTP
jgi:N-acetyl-anhydromuramyl-L-alanine amidase AmpD